MSKLICGDFIKKLNQYKTPFLLLLSASTIGLLTVYFMTNVNGFFLPALLLIGLALLILTFKNPEVIFALFLASGAFKTYKIVGSISSFFDLTALLGLLSFIGVVYEIWKTKKDSIVFPKVLFLLYFLIVIVSSLSLIYSPAQVYGSEKLFKLITLTTFSFVAPFFLLKTSISFKRFLSVFLVIGILMVFDVFVNGLNAGNIGFYSALGANYLMFGRIEGFALIVCMFYFFINTDSILNKVIYMGVGAALLFGLLLSAARGPLISLIISSAFLSLYALIRLIMKHRESFTANNKYELRIINLTILIVIVAASFFLFFREYFATLLYRIANIKTGFEESLIVRMSMYDRALEVLLAFPRNLIGLGLGGYSVFYTGSDSKAYPHNIFLEIGSESGLFALLIFLSLVVYVFVYIIKRIGSTKSFLDKSLLFTILGLFIFMLINASFSLDINDNRLLFTIMSLAFSVKEGKSDLQT